MTNERSYDLIIPDVIAILPLLKAIATFGNFGGLGYGSRTVDEELASAIGTLTELEELARCAARPPPTWLAKHALDCELRTKPDGWCDCMGPTQP